MEWIERTSTAQGSARPYYMLIKKIMVMTCTSLQEVDLVCFPFTGFVGYNIMELAVYGLGDSYGLFTRYPMPQTATAGPIKIFSIYVKFFIIFFL